MKLWQWILLVLAGIMVLGGLGLWWLIGAFCTGHPHGIC